MRVCWNWQTGTFEGRVSSTYGFKSRHSHFKVQRWLSWSKAHDWNSCNG